MFRYSRSSNQAGFRANRPLTNDEIAHYAPSILAEAPHESRGERYAFIPTIKVLDGLRSEGWSPFEVRQTKVKDLSKKEATKHMIRLRHAHSIESAVGEEVPELVLVNSHDGSSSYQLLSGFFRMVCSNGLIAGDVTNDVRIRHTGNVVDDVIEGSYRVLENVEAAQERIGVYKSVQLERAEQEAFAAGAALLRFDGFEEKTEREQRVATSQLLNLNRWQDQGLDAWKTFNTVQENVIKGGTLVGRNSRGARVRSRAVTGVDQDIKLNKALWSMMDKLVQFKQGQLDPAELVAA
jgi:hypothetical protein